MFHDETRPSGETLGVVMRVLTSPADLTPEFLTSVFRARLSGADVWDCRCEPLTGEQGIAGTLLRVHLGGEPPEIPRSVILKLPPDNPGARAQLTAMGFFEREVGFYQSLADKTPVDTAACYCADFDPDNGDAFLLLEDLASVARNGSSVAAGTVEDVAAVLLALARMHGRWWQDDALGDQPWLKPRSMLDPTVVAEVFERGWPLFLGKLSIPVDDEIMAIKVWISSFLDEASTALFSTGPRTLIHNDVQGDNLFYRDDPDRTVVFVDWQLAAYARGAVDVANAIRGSLEPETRRSAEAQLLRGYHDALIGAGVSDYSLEQCQADYDLATVVAPARLASAVGLHPGLTAHPGAPWDTLFLRLGRN